MACIAQSCNIICTTFLGPIYSVRLKERFGLDESIIGLMFGIPVFAYVLSGPIIMVRLLKHFENRTRIHFGQCILVVGIFLIGPSQWIGIPVHLWIMILGTFLLGMGVGTTMIPIIPEMI